MDQEHSDFDSGATEDDVGCSVPTETNFSTMSTTAPPLSSLPDSLPCLQSLPLLPSGILINAKNTSQSIVCERISTTSGEIDNSGVTSTTHAMGSLESNVGQDVENQVDDVLLLRSGSLVNAKNTAGPTAGPVSCESASTRNHYSSNNYDNRNEIMEPLAPSSLSPQSLDVASSRDDVPSTITQTTPDATIVAVPVPLEANIVMAWPTPSMHNRNRIVLMGCFTAFLILVGVIGLIMASLCTTRSCFPRQSISTTQPIVNGTSSNSSSAVEVDPEVRRRSVTAFINEITLSGRTIAGPGNVSSNSSTSNSSNNNIAFQMMPVEEAAVAWLIEQDPLQLLPDSAFNRFRLRQRYALRTIWFRQLQHSIPWKNTVGWITNDKDECERYGLTCEEHDLGPEIGVQNEVTEFIHLVSEIRGAIPVDMGLLTALRSFYVPGNQITGTIPSFLGHWSLLDTLDVSANHLTGTLPKTVGNWSHLRVCYMRNNAFTGTLPESIGQWTDIEYFSVQGNAYNGTIPETIVQWQNVLLALFDGNAFTGSVPLSICDSATNITALHSDCIFKVSCQCCTTCT